ncbi:hypothetical protein TNCV_429541 [Trichonephila clavipes]|nr:hypothetical protein TNCV_429541 [Trichonephila clavipes]
MYYSIDMTFFYSKDTLVALHFKYDFWQRTATAGLDVVQSGRPIFDDFSNICGPISAITRRMLSSKWSSVCGYPHRPMTLHSPTKYSLEVLNHKVLEANSQVQNVKYAVTKRVFQ